MLAERVSSRRQNLGVGVGWAAAVAVAMAGSLSACGSAPEKVAFENKVFYQYDTLNPAQAAKSLEAPHATLGERAERRCKVNAPSATAAAPRNGSAVKFTPVQPR